MKVIGLLSGGKDSCFNLLHCAENGHDIVALATLGPPSGTEELDSYLYQTVGQDAITYIAQAMDLPLHRRTISGKAVDQELQYRQAVEGDETEDLYELLIDVLRAHPDVKGVAVGAILSTYQRIRVEHVCARLGLTAIAYLWQRDQMELLDEMKEAGMDARIIKVAGAGLGVKHLNQNVAGDGMIGELTRLHARFGLHPCGEGGEYETFTVDCPLFKRRIELLETELVHLSSPDADNYSIVAYLRIKSAKLVDKIPSPSRLLLPPLLDEEALAVELAASHVEVASTSSNSLPTPLEQSLAVLAVSRIDSWVAATSVTAEALSVSEEVEALSVSEEVTACFVQLASLLAQYSLTLSHLAHIDLLLSSMADFPAANAAYIRQFPQGSPPTRACVGVRLSVGRRVELDALACSNAERKSLHVQGLSYWSPANIGPYSQAVSVAGRHFVAGQIGLVPADLSLPTSLPRQLALSCQHERRIMDVVSSDAKMDCCVCWIGKGDWAGRLAAARAAWRSWGVRCPVVYVEAEELPRGALVEWQCTFREDDEAAPSMHVVDLHDANGSGPARPLSARIFYTGDSERSRQLASTLFASAALSFVQVGHLAVGEDAREAVAVVFAVTAHES